MSTTEYEIKTVLVTAKPDGQIVPQDRGVEGTYTYNVRSAPWAGPSSIEETALDKFHQQICITEIDTFDVWPKIIDGEPVPTGTIEMTTDPISVTSGDHHNMQIGLSIKFSRTPAAHVRMDGERWFASASDDDIATLAQGGSAAAVIERKILGWYRSVNHPEVARADAFVLRNEGETISLFIEPLDLKSWMEANRPHLLPANSDMPAG